MDSKEIKPVNPKGKQPEIFIGRTAAEAEAPILWPPDMDSQLIGKDPDSGKDWRVEEKGKTEDEIVGWYHQLNGHEFEQTPGDGEGQGSLECCSPWGRKELDTTERLKSKVCSVMGLFTPTHTHPYQIMYSSRARIYFLLSTHIAQGLTFSGWSAHFCKCISNAIGLVL